MGIVHLPAIGEPRGKGAREEGGGEDDGNISLPRSKSPEKSTTDSQMDFIAKEVTEAFVRGSRNKPAFLKMNSADRALLSKRSSPPAPLSPQPSERSPTGGVEGSGRELPGKKRGFRYLNAQKRGAAEREAAREGSKRRFGVVFGFASVALVAKTSSGLREEPDWTTAGGNVLSRKSARRWVGGGVRALVRYQCVRAAATMI